MAVRLLLLLRLLLPLLAAAAARAAGAPPDANAAAAAEGVPQKGNPFVDEVLTPPTYSPPPHSKMWNLYEIPEMPERFEMFFRYDNRLDGRWVYDFRNRKTLVEYFTGGRGARGKSGFYADYTVLKEKLLNYETAGSPGGERCAYYDLVVPYSRMWSPRAWRKIDVFSIDFSGVSPLESERLRTSVAVAGVFDDYKLQFTSYTNGTARRISIGNHHWKVHSFVDYSSLDREGWEATAAFRDLHEPELQCTYAGGIDTEYMHELQAHLPFMLFKPTRNPKLIRKAQLIRKMETEGLPQAAEAVRRGEMPDEAKAAAGNGGPGGAARGRGPRKG